MDPKKIADIDQYLATLKTIAQSHALYYETLISKGISHELASHMTVELAIHQFHGMFHNVE